MKYMARMGEKRNAYRTLVEKSIQKREVGRHQRRQGNIKIDLRQTR